MQLQIVNIKQSKGRFTAIEKYASFLKVSIVMYYDYVFRRIVFLRSQISPKKGAQTGKATAPVLV